MENFLERLVGLEDARSGAVDHLVWIGLAPLPGQRGPDDRDESPP